MNENLLEKYCETWTKVCNIIKKEFVIKPVYHEKYLSYLKIKIKVIIKKSIQISVVIPKKNSQCICLSIILLESVIALGKHYHPQVFLEKCY